MNIDNNKRKELVGKTVVISKAGISGIIIGFDNEIATQVIIQDRSHQYHCFDIEDVEIVENP